MADKKGNSDALPLLPHVIKSEEVIIGTCLSDNSKLFEILDICEASDFILPETSAIVSAMLKFAETGKAFDEILISQELATNKYFIKKGGTEYLKSLPKVADLKTHAELVKAKSLERQKIQTHQTILSLLVANKPDGSKKIKELEHKLFELERLQGKKSSSKSIVEISDEIIKETFKRSLIASPYTGLITGFTQFDNCTAGLQKEDLILIAARPSIGKSAFALNIAENIAFKDPNKVVVFFSLEMSKESLINRIVSSQGRIPGHKIRSGMMNNFEWARFIGVHQKLKHTKLKIEEEPGISPFQMMMTLNRIHAREGKIDLIIVDYLQLMKSSTKAENRQQEITQISGELKALAKLFKCPLIALSQLSRASENRTDHRPQLSDLRDSGSLEQDCDICVFLYREEYYKKSPENENLAEIIIAKHRNGATGTIDLAFLKEITKFLNLFPYGT